MSRQSERRRSLEDLKRPRTCRCCGKRLRVMFFRRQRIARGSYTRINFCTRCMDALERGRFVGATRTTRAVMMCKSGRFRLYLDWRIRKTHGLSTDDMPDGTHNEQDARDAICRACGVSSRSELDRPNAAAMFDRIERDYVRWASKQQESQQWH
ncbi:hypothetical protein LMG33810_002855 [Carnimonas sp. LMG 33810]|uniref:hypothetical protein n=1 Tax=Carnimonas bestiolae TaxID=3402172 RepID=UPI003EDBFF8F